MISTQEVADSVECAAALMADAVPASGFRHHSAGLVGLVSGIPVAAANGVIVTGEVVTAADVAEVLTQVRAAGLPFCLQCRPAARDQLSQVAAAFGLELAEDATPLMVLDEIGSLRPSDTGGPICGALEIRCGGPELLTEHAEAAAAGFEAPAADFLAMNQVLESAPGLRVVLGEVGGTPVATALTHAASRGSAGVFNVATAPAHRGHGYGGAVSAAAVAAAAACGATWIWLQSSRAGHPVYRRLGFRDVEHWPLWVGAAHQG